MFSQRLGNDFGLLVLIPKPVGTYDHVHCDTEKEDSKKSIPVTTGGSLLQPSS